MYSNIKKIYNIYFFFSLGEDRQQVCSITKITEMIQMIWFKSMCTPLNPNIVSHSQASMTVVFCDSCLLVPQLRANLKLNH